MITLFPVVDSKRRARSFFSRRSQVSDVKLRPMIEKNKTDHSMQRLKEFEGDSHLSSELLEITEQMECKTASTFSISPTKSRVSPTHYRKNSTGLKQDNLKLNKIFNRTHTDWEHNFVGEKYMKKIKCEIKLSKQSSFSFKPETSKNKIQSFHKITEESEEKGQTQEKIEEPAKDQNCDRMKKLKERRRCRAKTMFNNNVTSDKKEDKQICTHEKIESLSPWEDTTPCLWICKN